MTTAALSERAIETGTWVRVGAIGGIVAGIVFAMFEMIMAAVLNGSDASRITAPGRGALGIPGAPLLAVRSDPSLRGRG